jgi:hypothetical protein
MILNAMARSTDTVQNSGFIECRPLFILNNIPVWVADVMIEPPLPEFYHLEN